jgi:hypothetical protein
MKWLLLAVHLNLYPPVDWVEQYPNLAWIPEVDYVEVLDTLPTEDKCHEVRDLILGNGKEVPKNVNVGCAALNELDDKILGGMIKEAGMFYEIEG